MKEYKAPKMIAKNAPVGSYAAGCPSNEGATGGAYMPGRCKACERTM